MSWTDERVETLKTLWAKGEPASAIARQMGGFEHTMDEGRSAVIGKVHRLGLPSRESPNRRRMNTTRQNRLAKPRKPKLLSYGRQPSQAPPRAPEPLPPIHVDDVPRVSFADLEPHHCRFPVGDPQQPGFGFCGGEKVEGLPYCAGHVQRAYVPAQPRRSGNSTPSYTHTVVRLHPPVSADERESVLEKV